ncbi:MAG: protein kinase [Sedimentisphaerales bacterium]|nr:protein kinase [Sedimentisphaerales bacterium]
MKTGETYGIWTLRGDEQIGQGGNSIVWRATAVDHESAAIKFLTRFGRYARFRDEVLFQKKLSEMPGVLPLLDEYLPDSPTKSNRPWLVTPYATSVRDHIERSENKLVTAVKVIRDIARTIVDIHAQEAAHRDIKPENLFIYSDRAVIGDFGLISYPGKKAITTCGERLGSIHYVAPELIGNVDEPDDCRPGDVYALAKTLWVLSTGQRYPIPGNLSSYEEASQLSAYVHHQRAVLLERLLDRATALNPKKRPTSSDFAQELDAWLNKKRNTSAITTIPETTSARLQQLTEVGERARKEQGMAFEETQQILSNVHGDLVKMGEQIAQAAGIDCRSKRLPEGNTNISLHFFPYSKDEDRRPGGNRCFEEHFRTVNGKTITVKGCVVLETIPPSTGVIKGGLVIAANHRPTEYILQKELKFRFGSAAQESIVFQFLSDLQSHLSILAARLAEVLLEENTISSN